MVLAAIRISEVVKHFVTTQLSNFFCSAISDNLASYGLAKTEKGRKIIT